MRAYKTILLFTLMVLIISTSLSSYAQTNEETINLISAADLLGKEKYDAAINEYEYLLNNEKNHDKKLILKYLTALCAAYELNDQLRKAELICQRSLQLSINIYGKNRFETASSYDDLALIYADLGKFNEARKLSEISLKILNRITISNKLRYAEIIHNNAMFDVDPNSAYSKLIKSLEIADTLEFKDNRTTAVILRSLGSKFADDERYDDAKFVLKRSIKILSELKIPEQYHLGLSLAGLGKVYYQNEDYFNAEKYISLSIEHLSRILSPTSHLIISQLNQLGLVYINQKNYQKAKDIYESISNLDVSPPYFENLGYVYWHTADYLKAEECLKKALELILGNKDDPEIVTYQNNLAIFYNEQGKTIEALKIIIETINKGTAYKSAAIPILYDAGQKNIITKEEAFNYSFKLLEAAFISDTSKAYKEQANRAKILRSDLSTKYREFLHDTKQLEFLNLRFQKLSIIPSEFRDKKEIESIKLKIKKVTDRANSNKNILRYSIPNIINENNQALPTSSEIQKMLNKDEAYVAFEFNNKGSFLFCLTKESFYWTRLEGGNKYFKDKINFLKSSLTFLHNEEFDISKSYELYSDTISKIAHLLEGKKKLLFKPDGPFVGFPLALLVTSKQYSINYRDVDWLFKKYSITYVPSAYSISVMKHNLISSKVKKELIAFADPIFNQNYTRELTNNKIQIRNVPSYLIDKKADLTKLFAELPRLPSTREEVESIARYLNIDRSNVYFGQDASEDNIKHQKLDQYRIVYFATHGLIGNDIKNINDGLIESALVLSIPHKGSIEDGLLKSSEVQSLKVNADWVVLSACNTATGEKETSLSGLARAFIHAGAKSVLVSNWDVSDESTKDLMIKLFAIEREDKSLSHGQLLQKAMLYMLDRSKNQIEGHPRNWSSFIVVGEIFN